MLVMLFTMEFFCWILDMSNFHHNDTQYWSYAQNSGAFLWTSIHLQSLQNSSLSSNLCVLFVCASEVCNNESCTCHIYVRVWWAKADCSYELYEIKTWASSVRWCAFGQNLHSYSQAPKNSFDKWPVEYSTAVQTKTLVQKFIHSFWTGKMDSFWNVFSQWMEAKECWKVGIRICCTRDWIIL